MRICWWRVLKDKMRSRWWKDCSGRKHACHDFETFSGERGVRRGVLLVGAKENVEVAIDIEEELKDYHCFNWSPHELHPRSKVCPVHSPVFTSKTPFPAFKKEEFVHWILYSILIKKNMNAPFIINQLRNITSTPRIHLFVFALWRVWGYRVRMFSSSLHSILCEVRVSKGTGIIHLGRHTCTIGTCFASLFCHATTAQCC